MRDPNLFSGLLLADYLNDRQGKIQSEINGVLKDQFLNSNDQELIDHITFKLKVEPLELHEKETTMEQKEVNDDGEPFCDPGTQVKINIPFTGEKWIFGCRTHHHMQAYPKARVQRGCLTINIFVPYNNALAQIKPMYERQLDLIRKHVNFSRDQVICCNEKLPELIQQAITQRRDNIHRHEGIPAILGLPLITKLGAPSITPVKLEIRRPPPLPNPPKTGFAPEPGVTNESFDRILQFIRHQGRTFETTPATYATLHEEALRDIMLAQLNGHFRGNAMGEVFRRNGKTDICIEQENRSAFVGECKLWAGTKALSAALDQLLSYLIWRDCKAALIIFNKKNKNFTKIRDEIPKALKAHQLFIRDLPCEEDGEWRMLVRSAEDEERRITLHVFAFNLFSDDNL